MTEITEEIKNCSICNSSDILKEIINEDTLIKCRDCPNFIKDPTRAYIVELWNYLYFECKEKDDT